MSWGSSKGGIGGSGVGWSGSGNESRSQAAHNGANVGRSSGGSSSSSRNRSGSSSSGSNNSASGSNNSESAGAGRSADPGGRRGAAADAFGGMSLADPASFGLSPESVSQGQQQYGGVLDGGHSGRTGYGIGESMPGMTENGRTAQEVSRGGPTSGSFDKGYGLEGAISEIGTNSRRGFMGQLGYESRMTSGAMKARNTALPSSVLGIVDAFAKPDDPVSRASFQDVRDHGLSPVESAIGNLAGYALNSIGVPGLITTGAKAVVDTVKQTDYANTRYGLPANDRRSTATDVFGSRSGSSSGSPQQIATATPASLAPEGMAIPDYESWNYGTHLKQFSA